MGQMKVELTDEQLDYAVQRIVDEEMPEAVREIVRKRADVIIKERIDVRLGAVVDDLLANEQFVYGRAQGGRSLDDLIRGVVKTYLDERVYLYSATDDRPSVRFAKASYDQHAGPTRLEEFVRFTVERFCDDHLANKMESTVKTFVEQRGGIEQVAREQMAQLLKEKFKL
jgi:hypothetical protein